MACWLQASRSDRWFSTQVGRSRCLWVVLTKCGFILSECGFGQGLILTECGHENALFSRQAVDVIGQLQVAIPALTNAQKTCLAPGGMLPRDSAEPGGTLTPSVARLGIAHCGHSRRGRQWANPRDGQEPLALGMGSSPGGELLVVIDKPFLDLEKLVKEMGKELVTQLC